MTEVPTSSAVSAWVSNLEIVAYDSHVKLDVPTNCSMLLVYVQVCLQYCRFRQTVNSLRRQQHAKAHFQNRQLCGFPPLLL